MRGKLVFLAALAALTGIPQESEAQETSDLDSSSSIIQEYNPELYFDLTDFEPDFSERMSEDLPPIISDLEEEADNPPPFANSPRVVVSPPGWSIRNRRPTLNPRMMTRNFASLSEVLNQGYSLLHFPEIEGWQGILARTLVIPAMGYSNEVAILFPNHEAGGHLMAQQERGMFGGHTNFWEYFGLSGLTYYPNGAYEPSIQPISIRDSNGEMRIVRILENQYIPSEERMDISARGGIANMELGSELLRRSRLRREPLDIATQLLYLPAHSDTLFNIITGQSDSETYNDFLALKWHYPFASNNSLWDRASNDGVEEYFSSLSEEEVRNILPGERRAIYHYNQAISDQESQRFDNSNQTAVSIFGGALNPYSWTALVDILQYWATGDTETIDLPDWVPETTSYLGIPGPYAGLRWHLELSRGGVLGIDARYSPPNEEEHIESGGALGLRAIQIPFGDGWDFTFGGELIGQQDGTNPFDYVTWGGNVEAGIGIPIGEDLVLRPNVFWQSEGVWSPRGYEGLTFGLATELRTSFWE